MVAKELEALLKTIETCVPGLIDAGVLTLAIDGVELTLDPKRRDTSELEKLVNEMRDAESLSPTNPHAKHPNDEETEGGFKSVEPRFRK